MSKYINQLTDEEIEEFLNNNGYELVKGLKNHSGEAIPAIDRYEEGMFVRARKIPDELDQEIKSILLQKSPGLMALYALTAIHGGLGMDMDLIHITDFYMFKFCITEEEEKESDELCRSYIRYMADRFPTYVADFSDYCNSLPDDELENEDHAL